MTEKQALFFEKGDTSFQLRVIPFILTFIIHLQQMGKGLLSISSISVLSFTLSFVMSPPLGLGHILFFPERLSVILVSALKLKKTFKLSSRNFI